MQPAPHFSVFGVPVRVDPMFFLIPLLSFSSRDLPGAAVWTALVFSGVLIHELGHALTMRQFGFAPSITLHGLGGLTHFPAQAQPTPRQSFFITLAGPGAGLALGGLVWLGELLLAPTSPRVVDALRDALWINVGWSCINLLPVLPWDGGLLLDAALAWGTGVRRLRVVAFTSVVAGAGVAAFALYFRMIFLAYFGAMGVFHGLRRMKAAPPSMDSWLQRLSAGEELEEELVFQLMTQADPVRRAQFAELLAWARLLKRNYAGAKEALAQMGTVTPSASLRARLAAADGLPQQVVELLKTPNDADLPLLVSALLSLDRFDDVVRWGLSNPTVADLAAARLFEAGAFEQALTLCRAERKRTNQGRFAYNEACCLCRLNKADEAVAALQAAKALGCGELATLAEDSDLELVRSRPEVMALLASPTEG